MMPVKPRDARCIVLRSLLIRQRTRIVLECRRELGGGYRPGRPPRVIGTTFGRGVAMKPAALPDVLNLAVIAVILVSARHVL